MLCEGKAVKIGRNKCSVKEKQLKLVERKLCEANAVCEMLTASLIEQIVLLKLVKVSFLKNAQIQAKDIRVISPAIYSQDDRDLLSVHQPRHEQCLNQRALCVCLNPVPLCVCLNPRPLCLCLNTLALCVCLFTIENCICTSTKTYLVKAQILAYFGAFFFSLYYSACLSDAYIISRSLRCFVFFSEIYYSSINIGNIFSTLVNM